MIIPLFALRRPIKTPASRHRYAASLELANATINLHRGIESPNLIKRAASAWVDAAIIEPQFTN